MKRCNILTLSSILCVVFLGSIAVYHRSSTSSYIDNDNNEQKQQHEKITVISSSSSSQSQSEPEQTRRSLQQQNINNNNNKRPVMHTFYQRIPDTRRNTGMDDEADRETLQMWQDMWHAAGWDTRILTMKEAEDYVNFKKYRNPTIHHTNSPYNKYCFFRWMAMISVGGGWMADYDTFPLPHESGKPFVRDSEKLPNHGRFTVYEFTGGGGVPSLVSGSAEEWDRMLDLITRPFFDASATRPLFDPAHPDEKAKIVGAKGDKDVFTDMKAMMSLYQSSKNKEEFYTLKQMEVVEGRVAVDNRVTWKYKCNRYPNAVAFHMAHSAIIDGKKLGTLDKNTNAKMRAQLAREWILRWVSYCGEATNILD